jgi:hypothetical protein
MFAGALPQVEIAVVKKPLHKLSLVLLERNKNQSRELFGLLIKTDGSW